MVYIYRSAASTGAKELAAALNGKRLRGLENGIGVRRVLGRDRQVRFQSGDVIVGWGQSVPATGLPRGVRVLNGTRIQNKYDDAVALRAAGVNTVEVSKTIPTQRPTVTPDPAVALRQAVSEAMEEFQNAELSRSAPYVRGLSDITVQINRLTQALGQPVPVAAPRPVGEWIARVYNHVGGNDLLTPPARANYYSKKEAFVKEYRVHSFLGKSIRAGVKAPREGFTNPHPWIRSYDAGWTIRYDGVSSKKRHREIAHAAVEALGLQFGAVDIGERADKSLVVLEVNRAAGLDGGTPQVYANAIQKFINGEWS